MRGREASGCEIHSCASLIWPLIEGNNWLLGQKACYTRNILNFSGVGNPSMLWTTRSAPTCPTELLNDCSTQVTILLRLTLNITKHISLSIPEVKWMIVTRFTSFLQQLATGLILGNCAIIKHLLWKRFWDFFFVKWNKELKNGSIAKLCVFLLVSCKIDLIRLHSL